MTAPQQISKDTKTRIIESALLCFAEHGYEGTGIRDISSRAETNSSLVAYHFGGKAGLYEEVLRHLFRKKASHLLQLASVLPVGPETPRPELIQGLTDYIRLFMETVMSCTPSSPLDAAAMTLLAREAESPTPGFEPLFMSLTRPITNFLDRCLAALRPDLGEQARYAMIISITGQMIHLRNSLGSTRLYLRDPAFPQDLPALIQHFIGFSLRGLDLPEAFAQPRPPFNFSA
jgi:AcrR family transcriptional regulator